MPSSISTVALRRYRTIPISGPGSAPPSSSPTARRSRSGVLRGWAGSTCGPAGGSPTARMLRPRPAIVAHGVRLNLEADSLNAAILAPDVELTSEAGALFVADVVRDMTQKTGQKCTAIRRVLVPADRFAEVAE